MLGAIRWELLAAFAATWLAVALYGLTAAGHFPHERRSARLRTPLGGLVLWGSMAAAVPSGLVAVLPALDRLPWPAVIIAGGLVLLLAPICLQALPDSFVDGRRGLMSFAIGAVALAAVTVAL